MALAFAHDHQTADESRLRQALALSIDRAALSTVLLQGGGEPAGGLLPNWMTGYEFLFRTDADLPGARQARGEVRQASVWTLAYDATDPLARVVAERIVLNARDAGITLQLASGKTFDLQLVRIPIVSLDARIALTAVADSLHLPPPKTAGTSSEDLYAAESVLLDSRQVIPLLHLRASYGMTAHVRNWSTAPNGSWHLSEIWLSPDK
jgi:ABC-type oligopeptide transport system substrate-binding subunit